MNIVIKVEVKREEIKIFKGLEFLWEGDGVFLNFLKVLSF